MTQIRPALIARLYKAVDQGKQTDAVMLLSQLFDGNGLAPDLREENFLQHLRETGEILIERRESPLAEECYLLGLTLYDAFFHDCHYEGIAISRRLAELYSFEQRESELSKTLDHAYVIVQRIARARQGHSEKLYKAGTIAESLSLRRHIAAGIHHEKVVNGADHQIQILLVEDNPDDADIFHEALAHAEAMAVVTDWAQHLSGGLRRLGDGGVDVVVLDLSLPDSSALDTLLEVRERFPKVPVVVLTGLDDSQLAIRAIKNGAHDFLIKGQAHKSDLLRSIISAVAEGKVTALTLQNNYHHFIQSSPLALMYLSKDLRIESLNEPMRTLTGGDWTGKVISEVWDGFSYESLLSAAERGAGLEIRDLALPDASMDGVVTATLWPVKGEDGKASGFFVACTSFIPTTELTNLDRSMSNDQLRLQLERGREKEEELKHTVDQQRALSKLSQKAQTSASPKDLCDEALPELASILEADAGFIFKNAPGYEALSASKEFITLKSESLDPRFEQLLQSELGAKVLQFDLIETPSPMIPAKYRSMLCCCIPSMDGKLGIAVLLFEQEIRCTDEDKIFLETMCAIIGTGVDRRMFEDKLIAATKELTRSNTDLQQFASAAAHDLQEPLRSIVSYMELLTNRTGDSLDEKSTKYLNISVAAARRMQALINDLLQYSRVGTRVQPFEPTDCNVVLSYVLNNLSDAIHTNDAVLEIEELPTVLADASQMAQVFQNLISNAIKFRSEDVPVVRITSAQQDDDWVFSVRDNGIGFDMQYANRIFVIFQRLHTRTKYAGTGIGLSLCKRIIEQHGGRIWVESTPGKGTTVSFTLPITRVDK